MRSVATGAPVSSSSSAKTRPSSGRKLFDHLRGERLRIGTQFLGGAVLARDGQVSGVHLHLAEGEPAGTGQGADGELRGLVFAQADDCDLRCIGWGHGSLAWSVHPALERVR